MVFNELPKESIFCQPDPASSNSPEGGLERSRKGPVYSPKTLHAATELVRPAAHCSPLSMAKPSRLTKCASTLGKTRLVDNRKKTVREY